MLKQYHRVRQETKAGEWRMYSGISGDGTWEIEVLVQEDGERLKVNERLYHNEGEATRSA